MKIYKFTDKFENLMYSNQNWFNIIKVGDYVKLEISVMPGATYRQNILIKEFLEDHIGQITDININRLHITVRFDVHDVQISFWIEQFFIKKSMVFGPSHIKYYAKTKDELELKITSDKYNL